MNVPVTVIEGVKGVRLLSFSLLLNNTNGYNKFFSEVYGVNFFLSTFAEPVILSTMNNIESTKVFEPVGNMLMILLILSQYLKHSQNI